MGRWRRSPVDEEFTGRLRLRQGAARRIMDMQDEVGNVLLARHLRTLRGPPSPDRRWLQLMGIPRLGEARRSQAPSTRLSPGAPGKRAIQRLVDRRRKSRPERERESVDVASSSAIASTRVPGARAELLSDALTR